MFARTLGSNPGLVPLQQRARGSLHLKAWAVRTGNGWPHLLLIDKGRRHVRVLLRIPAGGEAATTRLRAPSARARSGVTLGGQTLGPGGQWQGRAADQTVERTRRGYVVIVPRLSAALVSVRLQAGVLQRRTPEPAWRRLR